MCDDYLETEFDWAMFVEAKEVKHYLSYEGSLLKPLTKVRIYYRVFPHPAKVYEDLWYSKDALIGLRRQNKLNIKKGKIGIVVVGKAKTRSDHSPALANALVVLALDLQFRQIVKSVVLVPLEQYDQITANLANYRFLHQTEPPEEGKQMSIHIRSSPGGKDEYYYMR